MRPGTGAYRCLSMLVAAAALLPHTVSAQTTSGREATFMPLRFLEDVEAYCPTSDENSRFTLKCLQPMGRHHPLISLGGEVRWKLDSYRNPAFGSGPAGVTYPLQRMLVHADARLSSNVRAFAQLGHHVRYGSDSLVRPSDESDIDLQQGFVDILLRQGPDDGWGARLGRQELGFGSTRFVGAREGANMRLSFDAALLSWRSPNRHRIEAFAGRPVRNGPGAFDDVGDNRRAFWGVYTTSRLWGKTTFPERPTDQALSLDLYYLGFENTQARFVDATGAERRAALGARLFGRRGAIDLDWEAQTQRGSVDSNDIRAWTVATDTGWTATSLPWTPRLGLRADIASGDARRGDGELGSLQPLFASPAYFSEAALVAPVNLMSLNPHLTVTSLAGVRLQFGWNVLWKQQAADAFYRPGPVAVQGTAGGARRIGDQVWLGASLPLTRHVSMATSLVHFNPGPVVRQGGGRSVSYGTFSLKVQF